MNDAVPVAKNEKASSGVSILVLGVYERTLLKSDGRRNAKTGIQHGIL